MKILPSDDDDFFFSSVRLLRASALHQSRVHGDTAGERVPHHDRGRVRVPPWVPDEGAEQAQVPLHRLLDPQRTAAVHQRRPVL